MTRLDSLRRAGGTVLLALALGACHAAPLGTPVRPGAPGAAPTSELGSKPLEVDATQAASGNDATLTPQDLGSRVLGLLSSQREASARALVRRYPDVALQVLVLATDPRRQEVRFIATVHDAQCAFPDPMGTWMAFLQRRGSDEVCVACDEHCAEVRRCLRVGVLGPACEAGRACVRQAPTRAFPLGPEASRLAGIALLVNDMPLDAAVAFRHGVELARRTRPFECAHLLLLESEAARRAGRDDAASTAWTDAVRLGTWLQGRDPDLPDPGFWERAVNLKDPTWTWPEAAWASLGTQFEQPRGPGFESASLEALAWATAARQRLARDEPQGALIAFGRAGALATTPAFESACRLGQAKALIRLGEPLRAQALLGALAAAEGQPEVGADAMALWGAIELRLGHVERGAALLERAVPQQSPTSPDHADAQANLGLARLMVGDASGLDLLHEAQRSFEVQRDHEGWARSLENELMWLQASNAPSAQVDDVRTELRRAESS